MSTSAEVTGPLSDRQVRRILPIAIVLTWFGPFSMDAYTPAFPQIQEYFGTSATMVQLTLGTTLVGLALGQLVAGPLSDRFGRRRPLVVGLCGYVVASLLCAFASSVEMLVLARLAQGLTAATGIVIARAIGRDVHSGPALARFYSLVAAATALAPMIGPVTGAAMVQAGLVWRWIFGLTVVLGVVGLVLSVAVLPETHPALIGGRARTVPRQARVPAHLLRRPHVLAAAGVLGLCGAAMIANLAGLPFYLQEERGLGPLVYAGAFTVGALCLISGSNLSRLLQRRILPQRLLTVAVPVMLTVAVLFALAMQARAPLFLVLPGFCALMACWGFLNPNAMAFGMTVERTAAGRASAVLGLAQFGFAAASAPLVGIVPRVAGVPSMAVVTVSCIVLGALVHFALLRPARVSAARWAGPVAEPVPAARGTVPTSPL
ncbi:multidrug effflux MFS transporter [Pseudonocardia ailaonensis]|uniref:Multidrug effflux MFS transporter n=1 Tax=Pseudonocardia ailaonensis TaxID=367279 RepID=A0ABN2NE44_9PSEU